MAFSRARFVSGHGFNLVRWNPRSELFQQWNLQSCPNVYGALRFRRTGCQFSSEHGKQKPPTSKRKRLMNLVLGGLEPPRAPAQGLGDEAGYKAANSQASSIASPKVGKVSPELAAIAEAWPKLRPEIRTAILTLIHASTRA